MRVSVICASDRVDRLPCLVWSLVAQTHKDWELIILDQMMDGPFVDTMVTVLPDSVVDKVSYAKRDFHGDWGQTIKADAAVELATGDVLMFPNDDAYYMPVALEELVGIINDGNDIAVCGWVYDKLGYAAMMPSVRQGYVDVGGFMIKRDLFTKVGWNDRSQVGDATLIAECIAAGGKVGMSSGVLYVKN